MALFIAGALGATVGLSTLGALRLLTPSPVRDLEASYDGEQVVARWRRQPVDWAVVVTYCNGEMLGGEHVTSRNYYKLPSTELSKKYRFKVCARSIISIDGDPAWSNEVVTPPPQVLGIEATVDGTDIHLRWREMREKIHVRVIRNGQTGSEYVVSGSSVLLQQTQPSTCQFLVWAVNEYGIRGQSTLSNEVSTC